MPSLDATHVPLRFEHKWPRARFATSTYERLASKNRARPRADPVGGCFDPISPIQHDIRHARETREAAQWTGTYHFKECAENACWEYVVAIDNEGGVKLTARGPDLDLRCVVHPRPKGDDMTLQFEKYADGKTHLDFMGLSGEFHTGQKLAVMTRRGACLRFEDLASKIGTKQLCR
jgi:hypothetical protein